MEAINCENAALRSRGKLMKAPLGSRPFIIRERAKLHTQMNAPYIEHACAHTHKCITTCIHAYNKCMPVLAVLLHIYIPRKLVLIQSGPK